MNDTEQTINSTENPLLQEALDSVLDELIEESIPSETPSEEPVESDAIVEEAAEDTFVEESLSDAEVEGETPEETPQQTETPSEEIPATTEELITDSIQYINNYIAEMDMVGASGSRRFQNSVWFETMRSFRIGLIGVGGIGSHTAFCLGRLSPFSLALWDMDIIEEVNMAGQLYTFQDCGSSKVSALQSFLRRTTETPVHAFTTPIANDDRSMYELSGRNIMICGLDNMETRKDCWELFKKLPAMELYIDGRLSLENLQIFCITKNDTEAYEAYEKDWLFSSEEAIEAPCGAKQTTFTAALIGSLIANLVVNYAANKAFGIEARPLPFYTSYDSAMLSLKTEYVCPSTQQ